MQFVFSLNTSSITEIELSWPVLSIQVKAMRAMSSQVATDGEQAECDTRSQQLVLL